MFIIKIIDKELYWSKTGHADGNHVMVEKDILKEALLLHHTTIANNPPANYLCKFIQFFQDSQNYYLVMEHGGNMTLKQWSTKAFKYIEYGQLDINTYKKMVKYIFWQISVCYTPHTLYSLNNIIIDMAD